MKKLLLLIIIVFLLFDAISAQTIPVAKRDTGTIIIDMPAGNSDPAEPGDLARHDGTEDLAQTNTRFIFTGFTVKLHFFNVFNEMGGFPPFNYNGDTARVILTDTGTITTIRAKRDSIIINDDPVHNLEKTNIEIIDKHTSDSFKVYYAYSLQLQQLLPEKSYDIDDTVPASSFSRSGACWTGNSKYKLIAANAGHLYPIPKSEDFFYEQPGGAVFNEIKARLRLKEKIVTDTIAGLRMNTLIYKHKQCTLNSKGICLRFDRYVKGKYNSTKYLLIEYQDYE